jgi:hypothetical protein
MNDDKNKMKPVVESDPGMKMAHLEIEAILKKYDIGGIAILHKPGFNENIVIIDPSFSVVKLNAVRQLQIVPPLEDPNDPKVAKAKVASTVNLLYNLKNQAMQLAMIVNQAEQTVRKHFNIAPPPNAPRTPIPPGKNGFGGGLTKH